MIVAKFDTTKTATGSSSSNQLQLPFTASGTYNCSVDWGDGSSPDTITAWNQAETLHAYSTPGEYTVTITGPCPGFQTLGSIDNTKLTEVVSFDCGLVGRNNMTNTFRNAVNLLTGGIISGTASVTSFQECWRGCSSMTQPPDTSSWDTSAVKSFSHCWRDCTSMTQPPDTSSWDTSAVTTFANCWYNCSSMTQPPDTSSWDTSAVKNFSFCWYNCSSMTQPPDTSSWDTSAVTSFQECWRGCSSMTQPPDTSSWDTSSVTSFSYCWAGCNFRSHDYDRLLKNLVNSTPRSNVPMHAGSSKYTYQAIGDRDALLSIGWTITDGGLDPNWPDPRFTGIGTRRRLGT